MRITVRLLFNQMLGAHHIGNGGAGRDVEYFKDGFLPWSFLLQFLLAFEVGPVLISHYSIVKQCILNFSQTCNFKKYASEGWRCTKCLLYSYTSTQLLRSRIAFVFGYLQKQIHTNILLILGLQNSSVACPHVLDVVIYNNMW